ncbi:hypothetical protein ACFXAZ_38195 [Streptomyces sp. NPDC059477]|uniref:hypothetical protein n=1 Tax=Streptomyces sp. NPDC059477 TaxID=3346847 RepID=UPI0036C61422
MRPFRRKPAPPGPRPDRARIARLEHELLGVRHEPGSAEAAAVAAAQSADPDACAHTNVVETLELGQARRTGLCTACGAAMVQADTGAWFRP